MIPGALLTAEETSRGRTQSGCRCSTKNTVWLRRLRLAATVASQRVVRSREQPRLPARL